MRSIVKLLLMSVVLSSFAYAQPYDSLDINNINAGFYVGGSLFNDEDGEGHFEVPIGSGKNTFFSSGLWIGGTDVNGQLHLAVERFRTNGMDYSPGPLGNSGECDSVNYNKIWKLKRSEIDSFINWYQDPSIYLPSYFVPGSITNYPAHGDYNQGFSYYLFPYYDYDGSGSYDFTNGDYPLIRGDQSLLYVFNDDCGPHQNTQAEPMGIEVKAMAYAFDCPEDTALYNTIFVHYDIENRSNLTYHDTWVGLWSDLDIGDATDDFIASDVMRSAYYAYNGDDIDGIQGTLEHYGEHPPAQAVVFLGGPYQDNDNLDNNVGIAAGESLNGLGYGDGTPDNERLGMTRFVYHNNSQGAQGDPQIASEYYNYMKGVWRDGSPMVYGGNGHASNCTSCEPAQFMFPNDSDPQYWGTNGAPVASWTEISAANTPGDRRGLGSIGPFTFEPGAVQPLDVAFVFGRDYNGGAQESVLRMQAHIDAIRDMFVNDSVPTPCGGNFSLMPLGVKDTEKQIQVKVYPNPVENELNVEFPSVLSDDWNIAVIDVTGRTLKSYRFTENKLTIDIGDLSSGLYILQMDNSKEIISKPFIKK